MTKQRRKALRTLLFLTFGACLGKLDIMHAQNGQLTVDLDQWSHVVFKRKGKRIAVSIDDVFKALEEQS